MDGIARKQGRFDWWYEPRRERLAGSASLAGHEHPAQIKDSLNLGGALLREIGSIGKLHKPKVEQAGFAVLKAPDIPSVLVETAFISNPNEEAKLSDVQYQNDIADALVKGLQKYFERNPPLARKRST